MTYSMSSPPYCCIQSPTLNLVAVQHGLDKEDIDLEEGGKEDSQLKQNIEAVLGRHWKQ